MSLQEKDLTKGPISPTLLRFAWPFFVMNLLHSFYGLSDLFIIGNWIEGSAAVSAVMVGFSVIFIFMTMLFAFGSAVTIMIGRAFGAKELSELDAIVGTMMTVFLVFGTVCAVVLWIGAPALIAAMQTPAASFDDAVIYVRICSIGIIFTSCFNMIGGILRGLGNSTTPMWYTAVSVAANLVLDILFVCVWNMGVAGAAIATTLADLVGLVFVLWYLRKKEFLFQFRPSDFCFVKAKMTEMFKLGAPMAVQDIMVNFSFLFIYALANQMGVAASAAFGIEQRLYGFTMIPALSMALALTGIVAQNMGAGLTDRATQFLKLGIYYSGACCIISFLALILFPDFMLGIFTDDKAAIAACRDLLMSASWELILLSPMFCLFFFINACGHTKFTMVNSICCTFILRVPLAFLLTLPATATLFELGFAAPITVLAEFLVLAFYYRTGRWRTYTFAST